MMIKFMLVVAVLIFIVVGTYLAFDWQAYLTDLSSIQNYNFLDQVAIIWLDDVVGNPSDGVHTWLDSTFAEVIFGYYIKAWRTFTKFAHFIKWVADTSNIVKPWNYFQTINEFNWGAV